MFTSHQNKSTTNRSKKSWSITVNRRVGLINYVCVQPRCVDRRIGVVNELDRRQHDRLTVAKFRDQLREGSTLILDLELPEFPYFLGQAGGGIRAKNHAARSV